MDLDPSPDRPVLDDPLLGPERWVDDHHDDNGAPDDDHVLERAINDHDDDHYRAELNDDHLDLDDHNHTPQRAKGLQGTAQAVPPEVRAVADQVGEALDPPDIDWDTVVDWSPDPDDPQPEPTDRPKWTTVVEGNVRRTSLVRPDGSTMVITVERYDNWDRPMMDPDPWVTRPNRSTTVGGRFRRRRRTGGGR
jgi:hypothetical protein